MKLPQKTHEVLVQAVHGNQAKILADFFSENKCQTFELIMFTLEFL